MDEFADEAVRSGTICSLARYLRRSVLGTTTTAGAEPASQPAAVPPSRPQLGQAAGGKPPMCAAASGGPRINAMGSAAAARDSAEASAGAGAGDSETADGDEGGIDLGRQAYMLRGMREWYALQGTACLGEYLECLAPVMQVTCVLCYVAAYFGGPSPCTRRSAPPASRVIPAAYMQSGCSIPAGQRSQLKWLWLVPSIQGSLRDELPFRMERPSRTGRRWSVPFMPPS